MQKDSIIDFTLTYNKFKKPLFNYVCKVMKSDILAEDIAHNVFLKLYDNLDRIRDAEKTEVWIFTTARNEIFSHFRKNKNRINETIEFHEEKFSTNNLYTDFERKELIDFIEEELKTMDESQSEVYYLKEFSGLSYKEIAQIMNITEDLVRSRIFKVRQKLRTAITKLERG
ncbi:MAG: sigma-70 family RNA polymerase sigma factor [Ignavibacteriales bacterium]|nr:sigma-70 family RNA polymerase sigma factor [Ignavibacteriales bacterium]